MYPPRHTQTPIVGPQSVSRARKRSRPLQPKDSSASKYRDRAKERRTDSNPDYAHEINQMAGTIDMEKSKFLGGDEKHTHLVKGLDLALLRKVRADAIAAAATDETRTTKNNFSPVTVPSCSALQQDKLTGTRYARCEHFDRSLISRMLGSAHGEGKSKDEPGNETTSRGAFGTAMNTYYMLDISTFAPHASAECVPTQMCRAQGADDAGWVESEGENATRANADSSQLVSGCMWDHALVAKIKPAIARSTERERNCAVSKIDGVNVNKVNACAPEPEALEDIDIDMFADD